ncbi:GAF domain-containing protein [Catenuloplanes nepalensis]|uniref:GAF domain-containing protein n=1 Tax=Catenuloplanes nepalensis TaxID=587533 RepID=A0ABT9MXV5_9ACTN|nr:GAF domain-containing protein [Catenuloplanes nepalensis]MDP9795861.1 GAF domain-containing protein [Catenuloplanes nepalensis]
MTGTVDARLAAVYRYEILDTPRDGTFEGFARVAARQLRVPIATVTIVDADRVWFAAAEGLPGVTQIGAEPGLCASAVLHAGPYVVNDALVDPRTMDHPLVRGELGLRFYAAAPITTRDGHRLGTVNVIDSAPRDISDDETTLLTDLAGLIAQHLDLRLATLLAVRAEQELRRDADARATASAALVRRMRTAGAAQRDTGTHPESCQLGGPAGCTAPAELKVADTWGDHAWGCRAHVEEILTHASSVFLASQELNGLAAYRAR